MSNLAQFKPRVVEKFELFTASGTWTLPPNIAADSSGNSVIRLTAIGGGGGGAKRAGGAENHGGNSGEWVQDMLVEVSANQTVTIGAAGAGSTVNYTAGSAGGNTVFGSITLTGGAGGLWADTRQDAQGGNLGHGYPNVTGSLLPAPGPYGARGTPMVGGGSGGAGGPGLILDATGTGGVDTGNDIAGLGYGAGGAGGTGENGGAGKSGGVLVKWWEYA
jgi:hypothetical protein